MQPCTAPRPPAIPTHAVNMGAYPTRQHPIEHQSQATSIGRLGIGDKQGETTHSQRTTTAAEQAAVGAAAVVYAYAVGIALNSFAIAFAGFRPLGHVFVQFMIWWQRYSCEDNTTTQQHQ